MMLSPTDFSCKSVSQVEHNCRSLQKWLMGMCPKIIGASHFLEVRNWCWRVAGGFKAVLFPVEMGWWSPHGSILCQGSLTQFPLILFQSVGLTSRFSLRNPVWEKCLGEPSLSVFLIRHIKKKHFMSFHCILCWLSHNPILPISFMVDWPFGMVKIRSICRSASLRSLHHTFHETFRDGSRTLPGGRSRRRTRQPLPGRITGDQDLVADFGGWPWSLVVDHWISPSYLGPFGFRQSWHDAGGPWEVQIGGFPACTWDGQRPCNFLCFYVILILR